MLIKAIITALTLCLVGCAPMPKTSYYKSAEQLAQQYSEQHNDQGKTSQGFATVMQIRSLAPSLIK